MYLYESSIVSVANINTEPCGIPVFIHVGVDIVKLI